MNAAGTLHAGAPLREAAVAAVVVHGRDQDPEYMVEHLVSGLGQSEVAYLLPRHAERTWYPGRFHDPAGTLEPWLGQALAALRVQIAAARAAGLTERRIVLVGFSQGACLVAELLARDTRRYGAAAILTGSLTGRPQERRRPGPLIAGMPMFFSGSRQDEWVGPEHVAATAEIFRSAGAAVTYVPSDDPQHHITESDRAAVARLLAGVRGG